MTQQTLAKKSKISPQYLVKIEGAKVDVGLPILLRIAKALRCPLAHLFGPPVVLTERAMQAGQDFDRSPPEIQQGVLAILKTVASLPKPKKKPKG